MRFLSRFSIPHQVDRCVVALIGLILGAASVCHDTHVGH